MQREIYATIGFITVVFQLFGVMSSHILIDFCAGVVFLIISLKILFAMIVRTHDSEKTYFSKQKCHSRSMNYRKVGKYSFQCSPILKFYIAFVSTFLCYFFNLSLYLNVMFAFKTKLQSKKQKKRLYFRY